jgi:hypothetical protein
MVDELAYAPCCMCLYVFVFVCICVSVCQCVSVSVCCVLCVVCLCVCVCLISVSVCVCVCVCQTICFDWGVSRSQVTNESDKSFLKTIKETMHAVSDSISFTSISLIVASGLSSPRN